MDRSLSLITMTDKNGVQRPLTFWMRELCQASRWFDTQDVTSSLLFAATEAYAAESGYSATTIAGCKIWPACRAAAKQRCDSYTQLFWAGLGCFLCMLVSILCSFMVPFLISLDMRAKAEKSVPRSKVTLSQFNTMIVGMFAFASGLVAVIMYNDMTARAINQIQQQSYYPYAEQSTGFYLAWMYLSMQVVGCSLAVLRYVSPTVSTKEGADSSGAQGGEGLIEGAQ